MMLNGCLTALSLMLLATAPADGIVQEQRVDLEPGDPGVLQVHVAISDRPDYLKDWMEQAPQPKVTLDRIKELTAGQTAYIAFIVTGYELDPDHLPNLEVDVSVLKPDGEALFEAESYATLVGEEFPEKGLLMAEPALEVEFSKAEKPGTYGIIATARDRVAGKEAKGGYSLMLKEPNPEAPPPRTEP